MPLLPGYPLLGWFSSALLLFPSLSRAQDRCPPVDIENGRIVKSSNMQLGDEITLDCNEGFRLIGERILRCELVGGKLDWHARPPFCHKIRCYPPDNIEFGSHSGQPFEEFHYGSTVTYACNEGFSLIGNPVRTCLTSADGTRGEWHPLPPRCKVVRCREPEIRNGRVTTKRQRFYTYGDVAMFECNPGYTMVGSNTCTCGPEHGWIPRFPHCVKGGDPVTVPPGDHTGGDPVTVPPGDHTGPTDNPNTPTGDEESKNTTAIIIGCMLVFLVVGSIVALFWKFRSSTKPRQHERRSTHAEFDKSLQRTRLSPKVSNSPKVLQ